MKPRRVIQVKTYKGFMQIQSYPDVTEEEWKRFRSKLMLDEQSIGGFVSKKVKEYIKNERQDY